jgi:hypothetical protein
MIFFKGVRNSKKSLLSKTVLFEYSVKTYLNIEYFSKKIIRINIRILSNLGDFDYLVDVQYANDGLFTMVFGTSECVETVHNGL